jgi:four helix bundle protein
MRQMIRTERPDEFAFEKLNVYQHAKELRKGLYAVARKLPAFERHALQPQLLRAAVSITSNIAEGHGRYNYQDTTRFCRIARGSLCETIDHLSVCEDEEYVPEPEICALRKQALEKLKLLNGYMKYLQSKKNNP